MELSQLNKIFGIEGKVAFAEGNGGLPMIHVNTAKAAAVISVYAAHALSFIPTGQQDLLWMSKASMFENGKAIRGGIPLCFPWFGPHSNDKTKPQHGFARLHTWQVDEITELSTDTISITLSLTESAATLPLWPYSFRAAAKFILSDALELALAVTNTGNEAFEYSDALHTYFNISDIRSIKVHGLHNANFYEGFGNELKQQAADRLIFETETNRRYVNHTGNCIIEDIDLSRKIAVDKSGSKVTVVWNPGEATAKTMSDIEPGGYKTYVCIEPANAYTGIDMITLQPGESHILSTKIALV